MALYNFQSITAAQASGYNGAADSLAFGAGSATQVSVAYLSSPEQVAVTLNGVTVNFGVGIYGDQDLTFSNGGLLYIGGPGADSGAGGASDDGLFGGAGADTLSGGAGNDILQGNQGADLLNGGAGNDSVYGGQDNDSIILGTGAAESNWSNGNRGDDTITASNGTDTILGGQGNDLVIGGSGGDFLDGNLGDDIIRGGAGADTILGEGGHDTLSGGGGADTFIFAAGSSDVAAATADRILDWNSADHISLPVKDGFASFAAQPGGTDYYGYTYAATTYDFSSGLAMANSMMAPDPNYGIPSSTHFVAGQVGSDVVIYADTDGDHMVDLAVILVGASLSSINAGNFI